ncbi:MAG: hypothetical protein E7633_00840 [Ruminococcaceae bacterium]|nr:hypothetical protein [Oscillospiraceae bacterium]
MKKRMKLFTCTARVSLVCALVMFMIFSSALSSYAATPKVTVGTVSSANSEGYYAVSISISDLSLASKKSIDIALSYNNLAFTIVKTEFSSAVKKYGTVGKTGDNPYHITITAGSSTLKPSGKVCTVYFEAIGLPAVGKYDIVPSVTLSSGSSVNVASGGINVNCSHSYEKHSTVDPSCTTDGYTLERCTKCDGYRKTDKKNAIGHDFKIKDNVAPTCEQNGYTVEECTRCSVHNIIDGEAALGHEFGLENYNVIAPTCSEKGYTEYYCLREGCDGVNRVDYTEMIDHIMGEAVVTDSTCQKHGNKKYYCIHCNTFMNEERLDLVPHLFEDKVVPPSCTSKGYTLRVCKVCSTVRREEPVDMLEHSYTSVTERESGCVEDGRIKHSCSCGDYYIESVPAVGHKYKKETVIEPTHDSDGLVKYECTVCSATYTESIKFDDGSSNSGGDSLDIENPDVRGQLSGRSTLILNVLLIITAFAAIATVVLLIKKTISKLILDE